MKIYPKISPGVIGEKMDKIVKNSEGIEIQFFDENGITSEFNFEDEIRKRKKEYPNLKEIIVHPPLSNYNLEMIVMKDKTIVEKQLKKMVELSKELNMKTTFLYHTYWTKEQYISTHLADELAKLLKIIENTQVTMLIENIYMIIDEKNKCSALEIVKYMDHPNLRTCIDTTHVNCKARIYKKDINELVDEELKSDDCEKYVKQVHFAAAIKNDGYIDKKTHGRKHESKEDLKKEYDWLCKHGMKDKNYITEVSEENYDLRLDQIEEIKMLEECALIK